MDVQLLTDYEKTQVATRQALPEAYLGLGDEEMEARLVAARAALGDDVVILGHHYQRDEVIRFADFTGDSLKLSRQAATRAGARFIVFCGVHFMAESADVLAAPGQQVILPDLAAGCSMADMAAIDQLETCWDELEAAGVTGVLPVTYINSAAAIKAFCGERGGATCTSSNAAAVMAWGWRRARALLMLPDQHLGRNTAYAMGVPLDEMVVWDPNEPLGGSTPDDLARARLILWKGHCSVHERFTVAQIDRFRAAYPAGRVIVHPECTFDVVRAADESGSTERIIDRVTQSPAGSVWAVGTEVHLVSRLARELAPERTVVTLDPFGCLCSTMFRVSPNHLLWVLESLVEGRVHNRIVVPEARKRWARAALDRMLEMG
jgi:quinolinate synthase